MKIADFLRGALKTVEDGAEAVVKTGIADVTKVFDTARTAITASNLPASVKTELTSDATAAQAGISGLAGIAGTELGAIVADSVDEATALFNKMTTAIVGTKAAAEYSAVEKAGVIQAADAVIAEIQTLATQLQVGITPAALVAA